MLKKITKRKIECRSLSFYVRDPNEDCNELETSLLTIKIIYEFEEKVEKLQWIYIREACRYKIHMELSQTQE